MNLKLETHEIVRIVESDCGTPFIMEELSKKDAMVIAYKEGYRHALENLAVQLNIDLEDI